MTVPQASTPETSMVTPRQQDTKGEHGEDAATPPHKSSSLLSRLSDLRECGKNNIGEKLCNKKSCENIHFTSLIETIVSLLVDCYH